MQKDHSGTSGGLHEMGGGAERLLELAGGDREAGRRHWWRRGRDQAQGERGGGCRCGEEEAARCSVGSGGDGKAECEVG